MRNEKQFKKSISEIAARIAEEMPGSETSPNQKTPLDVPAFIKTLDSLSQRLTPFYNSIKGAQQLEVAILYILEKMSIDPGPATTALRNVIAKLAEQQIKTKANDAISTADIPLEEMFNRINRR